VAAASTFAIVVPIQYHNTMPHDGSTQFDRRTTALRWAAVIVAASAVAAGDHCLYATPSDDLLNSLQPTADVNDFAGILSAQEREALEQRCRQLRATTGSQLTVVTLRSLQGGQIDDFTVKLFERWKVGQAEKDNGVMLLVAIDDRKVRIEVGYGLEPVLPDVLAGRIIQQQIVPAFRQKQYAAGLSAAVNRIAEIVERGEPAAPDAGPAAEMPVGGVICFSLFLIPWVSFPSICIGVMLKSRQFLSAAFLLIFPAFAVFLVVSFGMPSYLFLLVALCIAGGIVFGLFAKLLPSSRRRGGKRAWSEGLWTWDTPTWTSTGSSWDWGGSSWGGGFSGGGGGSWGGFGGGSSGGGGASGGW
jgi:uncharacterized protein